MHSSSVTGAGSGVCELTNQRRLGVQVEAGLKETGAKTEGDDSNSRNKHAHMENYHSAFTYFVI